MTMSRARTLAAVSALMIMPATVAAQAQDLARALNWKRCLDSNPDVAIAGCSDVIQAGGEIDGDLAIVFLNRGIAYRDKGEYDRATQDYEQAIRLNPSYANTFNSRAIAYFNQGQHDRAIQDYDQAIRLNPSHVHAFYNRGNAYLAKGQPDRAIQDYDQAIRLDPSFALAHCNRAVAYRRKGQHYRADQDFDQAFRLNPSSGDARQTGRCR
jgi:tetratricopeptide (TPR) repeat protein